MPNRLRTGFLGLLISVTALLAAWGYLRLETAAVSPSGRGAWLGLALFAAIPAVTIYGLVTSARGFLFGGPLVSRKTLLYAAFLMLALGACPWAYTRLLTGGSPGNEGAGMLGTMIFVFVGIPGFFLTIVGLAAGWLGEE